MKISPDILAISGSASRNSSNTKILQFISDNISDLANFELYESLRDLPLFDPELSLNGAPDAILAIRKKIENADAIIICTPEYVFSIPAGLKNLIEWCVSTTIFSDKSLYLITASAQGEKAKQELELIMHTLGAKFKTEDSILIQSVKAKTDVHGAITDAEARTVLENFVVRIKRELSIRS